MESIWTKYCTRTHVTLKSHKIMTVDYIMYALRYGYTINLPSCLQLDYNKFTAEGGLSSLTLPILLTSAASVTIHH